MQAAVSGSLAKLNKLIKMLAMLNTAEVLLAGCLWGNKLPAYITVLPTMK